jgi:hypothetical protein
VALFTLSTLLLAALVLPNWEGRSPEAIAAAAWPYMLVLAYLPASAMMLWQARDRRQARPPQSVD